MNKAATATEELTQKEKETRSLNYRAWVLLSDTQRAILRLREKELRKVGVSAIESALLTSLRNIKTIKGVATPAELSRWMYREPHSISGLVHRMEKRGLLKTEKNLDRKNLVNVNMTERGEQAYVASSKRQNIHKIMSILTEEERRQLIAILEKLQDRTLSELGDEERPPYREILKG